MAANIFGRYVWLIDTLRRRKRLTYEEINNLWKDCGLNDDANKDLPLRTFHNHREAVQNIFDVNIICDMQDGYKYYIEDPEMLEGDSLRCWLIDSYATLNQMQADKKLQDRIQFEDIPSGHSFLTDIIEAMRKNLVLKITHQGFGKEYANTFKIEPYFVKVFNRRWYVIARSPDLNKVMTYGLDRILNLKTTQKKFEMPADFNINDYFANCCGIISDKRIPVERVVVKAYTYARDYLSTLPLHSSQKEIARDDESATYEYQVRPTFDFLQGILAQTDHVEVLEPEWVRKEMKRIANNILSFYKNDQ